MRSFLFATAFMACAGTAAVAQGVKEPSNFGSGSQTRSTTTSQVSRPTTITNVPTNALPPGYGVQRTYRDGKLQTIVR